VNVGIIYCPVMQCKMINLLRLWKLFPGSVRVRWIQSCKHRCQ